MPSPNHFAWSIFWKSTPGAILACSAAPFLLAPDNRNQPALKKVPRPPRNPQKMPNFEDTNFQNAIQQARDVCNRFFFEHGLVGLSVGVSVNGKIVWKSGLGLADVETGAACNGNTVMRIGSISKPITAAILGQLVESGRLDLDAPIQNYVPQFPVKEFNGEKVTITTRMLASHLGGIRHYDKSKCVQSTKTGSSSANNQSNNQRFCANCRRDLSPQNSSKVPKSEFEHSEYYIRQRFASVTDALKLFNDDPLVAKPDTTYMYSTHGWTLLSAVLEGASGEKLPALFQQLFKDTGMLKTCLDENQPVVRDRAKYYRRTKNHHRLVNVSEVDNSYKWAGGGLLSNVGDLLLFGNAMLYSAQFDSFCAGNLAPKLKFKSSSGIESETKTSSVVTYDCSILASLSSERVENLKSNGNCYSSKSRDKSGQWGHEDLSHLSISSQRSCCLYQPLLKSSTVAQLWTPNEKAKLKWSGMAGHYGFGWGIFELPGAPGINGHRPVAYIHTGGSVGCTTALCVKPEIDILPGNVGIEGGGFILPPLSAPKGALTQMPRGICVAVLTNMQEVGSIAKLAVEVADVFSAYV